MFCKVHLIYAVYSLARHQNVSVSHQTVFVEWFVIILGPPLGNAPGNLCKCVLLRLTPLFWSYYSLQEDWEHTRCESKVQVSERDLLKHAGAGNQLPTCN